MNDIDKLAAEVRNTCQRTVDSYVHNPNYGGKDLDLAKKVLIILDELEHLEYAAYSEDVYTILRD